MGFDSHRDYDNKDILRVNEEDEEDNDNDDNNQYGSMREEVDD